MTGTGGYSKSETLSMPRSCRTRKPAFSNPFSAFKLRECETPLLPNSPRNKDPAARDLRPPRHGESAQEPTRERNETRHAPQLVANDREGSVHRDRRPPKADPSRLASTFQPAGKRCAELSAPRDSLLAAGARELETPRSGALPLDAAFPMIARTAPPERAPGPKSRRRPVVSTARPGSAIASIRNRRRAGRPKAISAPGPKRRGAQAA